jgi:hypothetical protein
MEQITKSNYISNMINIKNIAKILKIDIDEPFKIQYFNHKNPYKLAWYKLTNKGLMYSYDKCGVYYSKSGSLEGLLIGKHQVVK